MDKLEDIPVTTREPSVPYDRAGQFGDGWVDTDGNGCDTRNDILRRDMSDVTYAVEGDKSCPAATVESGVLHDKYTGNEIDFIRSENASAVQIDHIVPLSWAWRNGADVWDQSTRIAFANDPQNLIAVDGPTNGAKSDSGPSQWMPPNSEATCDYAAQFTKVVRSYELTLPASDKSSLEATLATCQYDPHVTGTDIALGLGVIGIWVAVLWALYGMGKKFRGR